MAGNVCDREGLCSRPLPIAGGGDPVLADNLVTACWNCNRRKGDLDLDEIGWALVEPRDEEWKGLTEQSQLSGLPGALPSGRCGRLEALYCPGNLDGSDDCSLAVQAV